MIVRSTNRRTRRIGEHVFSARESRNPNIQVAGGHARCAMGIASSQRILLSKVNTSILAECRKMPKMRRVLGVFTPVITWKPMNWTDEYNSHWIPGQVLASMAKAGGGTRRSSALRGRVRLLTGANWSGTRRKSG